MPISSELEPQFMKRLRYNILNAGAVPILRNDLINLIALPFAINRAYRLLVACRIISIKAWCIVSNASLPIGHNSTIEVIWHSNLGMEKTVRATQMGVEPAYLTTAPPKDSTAGFWTSTHSDLTELVVTLDGPIGSCFDITYECRLASNNTQVNFSIVLGSVGQVSYNNFVDTDVQGYSNYTPI